MKRPVLTVARAPQAALVGPATEVPLDLARTQGETGVDASDSGTPQHFGVELVVAQDGNDSNPGTKAQPFATLDRARDQIRDLKTKQGRGGRMDSIGTLASS